MELSALELLFGDSVEVEGICQIRQIKLKELKKNSDMLYYNHALKMISMGLTDVMQILGIDVKQFLELPEEQRKEIDYFHFLQIVPELRNEVCDALRFFIIDELQYDEDTGYFNILDEDGQVKSVIDGDLLIVVRNAILQTNYMKDSSTPVKFRSEKAKAIYMKIQAGKAKIASAKKGNDISLENVVMFVSSRSSSYNLFNIQDLTIYQLYSEFTQLNKLTQIDVIARRWATWGEEDFDWSVYYSSPTNKE